LCIKLVIETSLYYDARSEKYQIIQIPNFMKIRPVGAELFQAGGQRVRDKTKLLTMIGCYDKQGLFPSMLWHSLIGLSKENVLCFL
jgi:hypothetical protein